MIRLEGKVAIVTGGGTGLGRQIALAYAQAGAKVVVGDIREGDGEQTVAEVRASGGDARFVKTDVSVSAEVEELVATAEREYGALHIMTANAGMLGAATGKSFPKVTEDEFWQIVNVNFGGTFLSFKHAVPAILRAGGGAMTATGSLGGHRATRGNSAYGPSKAAVAALVRALALDLYPTIRVNEVSPAAMNTDFLEHYGEDRGLEPGTMPKLSGITTVDPRDVARVHLFLVSDEAAAINGQTVFADSGCSIVMSPSVGPER
jgi:NAD(P)-dependent dehydrogenase (short-subunit alcohol dehydrogenase family)